MALKGQAFLALWNDIAREREPEYDQWHTLEHVPERVAVTGIHGARRYVNRQRSSHRYFTLYDVASLQVFASPEYVDLLQHPTPWSASMRPDFSNFVRATCGVRRSTGIGIGAAIACLCAESSAVDDGRISQTLERVLKLPGITSVHWGSGQGGLPTIPWKPSPSATTEPRAFDSVLLIEALDRNAAAAALANSLAELVLSDLPADFGADVYDLALVFPGTDTSEPLRHRRPGWSNRR
jgi:hypothetical protein